MIHFVTTNAGKFHEVAELLQASGVAVDRLDRRYSEIQADSLEEVVTNAVHILAAEVEGDFLVDDSGLFVEALDGFPGVYSSYAYRTIGVRGLLCLLEGEDRRKAAFETVLGFRLGGDVHVFRGECRGAIAREARGVHGFGFDPIFMPEDHERTFAEMTTEEKNGISHRGRAAHALAAFMKER